MDPLHSPALLPQHVPVVHTLPAQPTWLPRLKLMDYSMFIRVIFPLLKPTLIDTNELIILRDQLEPFILDLTRDNADLTKKLTDTVTLFNTAKIELALTSQQVSTLELDLTKVQPHPMTTVATQMSRPALWHVGTQSLPKATSAATQRTPKVASAATQTTPAPLVAMVKTFGSTSVQATPTPQGLSWHP